jgi:predicted DNA binding protein
LRDVTELVCHGAGGILQVQVDEPIPPADLDRFETVAWWERLTQSDAGVTYLFKIEPTDVSGTCALDEHATAHDVTDVREGGFDLSVVGSQEEISQSITAIDEAGMTPLLERLSDFEGSGPSTVETLTDRQREVVETAYSMGYYEIPRTATTEDVATELGLDPSTVAEHLQRAERNVLGQLLEP